MTGASCASDCRARCVASWWTLVSSQAIIPSAARSKDVDLGSGPPYKNEKKALLGAETKWVELLPESRLAGDSQNPFQMEHPGRFTHLRLNIFPDGGVARLRVHGEPAFRASRSGRAECDLAAVENGGTIVASSDQFFGEPLNILMPGLARNMGEGCGRRGEGAVRATIGPSSSSACPG